MVKIRFIILFITGSLICSCEKISDSSVDYILFPIGRNFPSSGKLKVITGGTEFRYDLIYDSCGGYWIKIPNSALPENGTINFEYSRKLEELKLFKNIISSNNNWLSASEFIDVGNDQIKSKTLELTSGLTSNIDKAKRIQQFVIDHVELSTYKDSFLDKASKTYDYGYGTCMNFSRLFVAMCRAAGVPARTIWGIVYDYNDNNIYDFHHQWAEILDETGNWHPCDFSYSHNFDLNDIRYLDLIYAAEENEIIKTRKSDEIKLKDIEYFRDYPVTLSARLGFELIVDERPDSMIVRFTYEF